MVQVFLWSPILAWVLAHFDDYLLCLVFCFLSVFVRTKHTLELTVVCVPIHLKRNEKTTRWAHAKNKPLTAPSCNRFGVNWPTPISTTSFTIYLIRFKCLPLWYYCFRFFFFYFVYVHRNAIPPPLIGLWSRWKCMRTFFWFKPYAPNGSCSEMFATCHSSVHRYLIRNFWKIYFKHFFVLFDVPRTRARLNA